MNKNLYALLFGVMLTGAGGDLRAQVVQGSNGSQSPLAPLTLNKKTARRLSSPQVRLRADFVASTNHYFVLGFEQLLSPQAEALLAKHARILTYVPDNMYILTSAQEPEQALAALEAELKGVATIKAAGALPANYKIAERIYQQLQAKSELSHETVQAGVVVATFAPEDRQALEQTLDKWKVAYELTPYDQVKLLEATTQLVGQLAALPYVSYISVYEEPKDMAFDMNYITQTNRIFGLNYDHKGPIGRGVTFANWETYGSEDEYKLNTYGRNVEKGVGGVNLTDRTANAHGMQCGQIVAGADNIDENRSRGMAPGVQIIAMNDRVRPWGVHHTGVEKALQKGYTPLVSNHSVGWDINQRNHYNDAAATVDRAIYNSNAYMCCYPTGNYAYGSAKYDNFQDYDYGRISGDIKTNKNGLAVHSVIYPGVDVTWANFGPTFDGRMKPELCAQGSGGTSYASPGVAGFTSLLLEQCKDALGVFRVDVVKAVMINTALDVRTYAENGREAGFGLDYRTGYGEINPLSAARSLTEKRVKYDQSVSTGQKAEHSITVPEGQVELNVTLYWNDPAAPAGTSKTLINDLDLEVVSPDGQIVLPWTLDPSPATVKNAAVRAVNTRDNHERVRITAAKAGETIPAGQYTIRVKGSKVSMGPQNFVTTWQWKARGIEWSSVAEGMRLAPGENLLLAWDMTVTDEEDRKAPNFVRGEMTPRVYYRITPLQAGQEDPTQANSGWKLCKITSGLRYWYNNMKGGQQTADGEIFGKNFLQWIVPQELANTSHLQFMVVAGKGEQQLRALSPKAQVCEQPSIRPEILSISEEKVKLAWQPAQTVKKGKYLLYALYDKYMTKVAEVPIGQNSVEIAAPEGVKWNQDQFFAIAYYDEESQAQSKRSLPIGLDPYNTEANAKGSVWASTYTLCPGDIATFPTNNLEGEVQWYKAGKPVEGERGKSRRLQVSMEDIGRYNYTITLNDKVVFTSPSFTIASGGIKRSETEAWGDYAWAGFVYGKEEGSRLPELTETTPYHGRFDLNKFSFNSNTDLFDWQKGAADEIAGYVGCPSGKGTNALVVMKRRGFVPGSYSLKFTRASGLAKAIIVDASGRRVVKTTSVNSYETPLGAFKLNENSTIELHWTGVHCAFEVTYNSSAADKAIRPARVTSPTPTFWLDPNVLPGEDKAEVKRIVDAYPQAEVYTLTSRFGATLNKEGSNFNTALTFAGKSSYMGGMRKPNTTNTATDFVVLSSSRNTGNDRILSFGNEDKDDGSATNYTLVVDQSNRLGTIRNGNSISTTYSNAHMNLYTVRRDDKTVSIAHNGAKIVRSGNTPPETLNLQKISIGGSFDPANPKYLRGTLAEAIHYDGPFQEEDAKRVRTYLAIKHGITLDHDYVGTGTLNLYPLTSTSKYRYQVTGIGREDYSRLNQKQSRGQVRNGNPAMVTLALGDLAKNNAENPAQFATNGTYYILGADNDYAPNLFEGDVSRISYLLRSTLPQIDKAEALSLIVPESSFVREGKQLYLECSDTEFTSPSIDHKKLKPFKAYKVGDTQYLRAIYTPTAHESYLRFVWEEAGIVNGILTAQQATEAISYDASTRVLRITASGVERIDLTDLGGRSLAAALPVMAGKAQLPQLMPGTYMVVLRGAQGTLGTAKLNIVQ